MIIEKVYNDKGIVPRWSIIFKQPNSFITFHSKGLHNIEELIEYMKTHKCLNLIFLETCGVKEIEDNFEFIKLSLL